MVEETGAPGGRCSSAGDGGSSESLLSRWPGSGGLFVRKTFRLESIGHVIHLRNSHFNLRSERRLISSEVNDDFFS